MLKPIAVAWSAWAITGLAYASESCTDSELCWTRSTLAAEDAAAAGGGGLGGLGLGLGLAAALGGGGGGGSSAPVSSTQSQVSTPVLPPSTVASQSGFSATPNLAIAAGFETSEYQATRGLSAISASHVWSVGGLGAGTVVQVIDSGVDGSHAEFEGRVTQLIDHTGGDGADQRGHGTQMAGLIGAGRNGVGMVGVAPEASIVASKIFASGSSTTSQFNAWLPSALAQGRAAGATVVSNSWGSDAQIDDYSQTNLNAFYAPAINAFRSAVEAGQVLVFAAGNDSETSVSIEAGLPLRFSELESGWLAVTALSSSGSLASFANACGSAAAWCVAAPGYGYATRVGGGYGSVTGTSPATAYVAGALAALQSAFPTIALGDIRGRLLSTADDSVGSAVETGQGLIDLGAALNPVGEVRVTTTSGGGTGSLTTGGALGTAGLAEVSVTALDSLGFPFQMAIDGWIQAPMKSARSGLRQWQLTQAQVHSPANGFQASAVASRTGGLGIARLSGDDIGQWLRPVRWGAPAQAHPALVGWGESWVIQHQGGAIESYSAQDTDQHQRLGALRYQGQHGWLETSVHHEDAGYLGVRSDLIQLPSTTTHWLGMGLRTGGLSVSGWYGNTTRGDQVSAFDASLALGEWTLNIQQPARVEAGAVTVGVSTPGTVLGQVDWTQQVVSTVPDGREQRFGVTRWLGAQRGWHGFVRADAVHDAGHRAGVRDHELSAGVLRRF